jgi:hypothetical protein
MALCLVDRHDCLGPDVEDNHVQRSVLLVTTLVASWLGMQAAHELGHVLGAWLTGGSVIRVVLHPLALSRTDVAWNPRPLVVAWAGPVLGVLVPLLLWAASVLGQVSVRFLLRFFAGFCLVANGVYIGISAWTAVGDGDTMLRYGSSPWQLALFGVATAPVGLWLWHGQGRYFGLGSERREISASAMYVTLASCVALLVAGVWIGGD